jgi:hypothetical protein
MTEFGSGFVVGLGVGCLAGAVTFALAILLVGWVREER